MAANLEADWNEALRALAAAQDDYERHTARADPLDDADKARIAALATDFPALWSDPRTPQRERKRMVRLLIDDVTLDPQRQTSPSQVRFKAGQTTTFEVTVRLPATEVAAHPGRASSPKSTGSSTTTPKPASQTSSTGTASSPGTDQPFNAVMVNHIRRKHGLQSRYRPAPRNKACSPSTKWPTAIDVHPQTVKERAARGQLASIAYNDKNQRLYTAATADDHDPLRPLWHADPRTWRPRPTAEVLRSELQDRRLRRAKAGRGLETEPAPPAAKTR